MLTINIHFKGERQEEEFQMSDVSPHIKGIVFACAQFVKNKGMPELTITEVKRTKEEQAKIYPDNPDVISPHMVGRAVDLRTNGMESSQIEMLKNFINTHWKRRDGKQTCIVHDVGLGKHFHIQVEA